jgi:hypothetical protein
MERFWRSGVRFGGVDPWVLFIAERPSPTGLTRAVQQYDRCRASVGFVLGERLGEFLIASSS